MSHAPETEEWRAVPGYVGLYEVSSEGRIKSLRGKKLLRQNPATSYLSVNLYDAAQKPKTVYVHKLVAAVFCGTPPSDYHVVCHNDGHRYNNSASNLRYDTPAGNALDAIRHGTHRGENNGRSRLCETCVRAIKTLIGRVSDSEIARAFGVTPTTIGHIKHGRQWTHVNPH